MQLDFVVEIPAQVDVELAFDQPLVSAVNRNGWQVGVPPRLAAAGQHLQCFILGLDLVRSAPDALPASLEHGYCHVQAVLWVRPFTLVFAVGEGVLHEGVCACADEGGVTVVVKVAAFHLQAQLLGTLIEVRQVALVDVQHSAAVFECVELHITQTRTRS